MRVANIQRITEGSGIPNSYRYRSTGNADGSYHIGDLDDIALSDRTYRENGQKIYTDNFGLTRQDTANSVQRDYVVDYTSAIKNDLMVYEDGGFKTSYTYGANGRISQMTRHLEDEINPVTGKTISTTANAKGENINSDIAVEKLGKLYYHLDRLGSTAFITDESGMVRSYATYDEWGNVREGGSHDVNIASIDATAGFTTYTYDKVLDKYFAQYRMYDAEVKRYTAEDPAKNDLNWYSYVGNRPLVMVDPMGLYYIYEFDSMRFEPNAPTTKEGAVDAAIEQFETMYGRRPTHEEVIALEKNVEYMYSITHTYARYVRTVGYEIVPETTANSVIKVGVDVVPFPGASAYVYENMNDLTRVVGGNSAEGLGWTNILDVADASLFSENVQNVINKLGKNTDDLFGEGLQIAGFILTGVAFAERDVIKRTDRIIFDIINEKNLPTSSFSLETLELRMGLSYGYIENRSEYFYMRTIFGNKTLYEIDLIIANSKNPSNEIDKYVDELRTHMNYLFICSEFAFKRYYEDAWKALTNEVTAELKQQLEIYNIRISRVEDDLAEIFSLKAEEK